VDLVGDKLREVFQTGDIGIRWNNAQTGLVDYLYEYEHGERLHIESRPMQPGGIGEMLNKTRKPLVFNTPAELVAFGSVPLPGTDQGKSSVNVPMLASDRVVGSIILEDYEREYAYGESEVRLLQTLANSMSVALENARLFDETQRLLKETEQRNAELAIINSVQAGLAAKLDFNAIVDLVGDKVREIFNSNDISIALYDPTTNIITVPYFYEEGKRYPIEPTVLTTGITAHILRTRKPLLINEDQSRIHRELGSKVIGDMDANTNLDEQSYLGVPILKGAQAMGVIALYENHKHAFDQHARFERGAGTNCHARTIRTARARCFDSAARTRRQFAHRRRGRQIRGHQQVRPTADWRRHHGQHRAHWHCRNCERPGH
jgi:GAF domain-containing protein